MESVLKLPAQQALFDVNNNLVDIVIPGSSGIYDLSQSFVSILTRVIPEKSTVALIAGQTRDDGIYDVRLHFKHHTGAAELDAGGVPKSVYDNTATPVECLVNSCSMHSASKGMVEDIRRADILRGTLSCYQKDLDSRQAEALTTWAGAAKDTPWSHGQYVELYGEGTLNSREIPHEIRLPLKDLFDAGRFTAWDSSVYGDTRIHLELNLGQVLATQNLAENQSWNSSAYQDRVTATGDPDPQFLYVAAQVPGFQAATPDRVIIAPSATAGAGISSLTMCVKYDSLEDSPWWVGQDVGIQALNIGGVNGSLGLGMDLPFAGEEIPYSTGYANIQGGAIGRAIIDSITFDAFTGLVTLNFDGDVVKVGAQGDGTGGTVTGGGTLLIRVYGSDTAGTLADFAANPKKYGNAAAISYEAVELVATIRSDMAPGSAPLEHQYSHFVNQADQFSNTSSMQRTYQIPANCSAVLVAVTNTSQDFSSFLGSAQVNEYRFTIDGEQVTNRPVPYHDVSPAGVFANKQGSSLHYDLIQKTFLNMGVNGRYESLKECVYDQFIPTGTDGDAGSGGKGFVLRKDDPLKPAFFIATPVPLKETPSQILLEMDGNFPDGAALQIYSYVTDLI